MAASTRQRTIIWLAFTFALGLATVLVAGAGEAHRTRIVEHGAQTEAVIVNDHFTYRARWYVVTYTGQGQARTADLYYPWLIDEFPLGQILTVYVDPDDPELIATADGYATPYWTSLPSVLALLTIWAAFLTIGGHLSARRSRKPS